MWRGCAVRACRRRRQRLRSSVCNLYIHRTASAGCSIGLITHYTPSVLCVDWRLAGRVISRCTQLCLRFVCVCIFYKRKIKYVLFRMKNKIMEGFGVDTIAIQTLEPEWANRDSKHTYADAVVTQSEWKFSACFEWECTKGMESDACVFCGDQRESQCSGMGRAMGRHGAG